MTPSGLRWVGDDVRTAVDVRELERLVPEGEELAEAHVMITGMLDSEAAALREAARGRLALHLDVSSPGQIAAEAHANRVVAPEDFDDLGEFVLMRARQINGRPVALAAALREQADAFRRLFGTPLCVSVHHYLDLASPVVAACADDVAASLQAARRGRVVPISGLLGECHVTGGRTAIHAAGYPRRGVWLDADGVSLEPRSDIIVHRGDDVGSLAALREELSGRG